MAPERGPDRAAAGGRRLATLLFLAAMALAFAIGIARLLSLRLDQGDVYAPYSTLRADPKGAKALHDALALSGVRALRVFRPLDPSGSVRGLGEGAAFRERTALVVLGLPPGQLESASGTQAAELVAFVVAGGRLVIALEPVERRPAPPPRGPHAGLPTPTPGRRRGSGPPEIPLATRLGIGIAYAPLRDPEAARGEAVPAEAGGGAAVEPGAEPEQGAGPDAAEGAGLEAPDAAAAAPMEAASEDSASVPGAIPLRTAARLVLRDPAWRPLWMRDGKPVVAERPLGRGSAVVLADSYALGNEALRRHPRPALVAAAVGQAATVLFDESHLGVRESPGTMALARRLRLHGVFATVAVLGALAVWRLTLPFVPPVEGEEPDGTVRSARDHGEAIVDLLRRNVGPAELIAACLAEWRRTAPAAGGSGREGVGGGSDLASELRARVEGSAEPSEAYRRIAVILEERRRRGGTA